MKKLFSWLLVLAIVFSFVPRAHAEEETTVQPRYAYVTAIHIDFSINEDNGLSSFSAKVTAAGSYTVKLDCKLQKLVNGVWTNVYSWQNTSLGRATQSGKYYVYAGTYRLAITGTIYDDDNTVIEIVGKTSSTYTYDG